jgi:threonylcarbamoyladenosine tRNA methylthiotransferase CDKAL1
MAYSVYIETYGCSANQNNSEILAGLLASRGLNIVENESLSDIIILNTCIVKEPTIKKIEERIKNLAKSNKRLIIAGCMPDVFSDKLEKLAPKASFLGTHHVKDIVNVIKSIIEGRQVKIIGKQNEIKLCLPKLSKNKTIGIVQICQGCVNACSYCLVNKVKGNLFSFPEEKILKEVESNIKSGAKEIWSTSQDNACYGLDEKQALSCKDVSVNNNKVGFGELQVHDVAKSNQINNNIDISLPQLINKITSLNHRFFLRIGMMNPSSVMPITDELIKAYKNKKVYKFLHIPIQSGSNKILKLMNRKYKIEDALEIINKFKQEFPEIVIATDIIVGFPEESEDDFSKTLNIIGIIKPDVLNISKFWPLQGTEASKMKQIDKKIAIKRATELMNLHAKIALENKKPLIGKEYKVLVNKKGFQDTWVARNENYQLIIVRSKENLLGKFVKVKIIDAKAHYLIGEILYK